MPYRKGDHYVTCDRTGLKTLASKTRQEWTGALVRVEDYEARHPQDFVKGVRDDPRVAISRPKPIPTFTGPLSTLLAAAAAAGDQQIAVESSTRFYPGDRIGIALANKEIFVTLVMTVPDAATIEMTTLLPFDAESGALVTNYNAISQPDIG